MQDRIRGYDPRYDGNVVTWFLKCMMFGFLLGALFCVWVVHRCNVIVERDRPSLRQGAQ